MGAAIGTVLPGGGRVEQLEANKLAGKVGEEAAGISGKKSAIESLTKTAERRIPDAIDHAEKSLTEVKNKAKVYLTNQMKDFIAYAKKNDYTFNLVTKKGAELSKPLMKALEDIKWNFKPTI
jgi:hypothetical protein